MLTYPTETQARDQADIYRRQGYLPTIKRLNSDWAVNRGRYLGEIAAESYKSGLEKFDIEEEQYEPARTRTTKVSGHSGERARRSREVVDTRDEEETSGRILESRTETEETRYVSRKVPVTSSSEVRSVIDIIEPNDLRGIKIEAKLGGQLDKLEDMFGFLDFYIKLANPDKTVPDAEINHWANVLIPKLNAEAERTYAFYEDVSKAATQETDLAQKRKLQEWGFSIKSREVAEVLRDISKQLSKDNRLDKVLAIEKLVGTQHRVEPTIIPQLFGLDNVSMDYRQAPVISVLDYLALSESEKEHFLEAFAIASSYQTESELSYADSF